MVDPFGLYYVSPWSPAFCLRKVTHLIKLLKEYVYSKVLMEDVLLPFVHLFGWDGVMWSFGSVSVHVVAHNMFDK